MVPHPLPLQDQVELHPHEPARLDAEVPAEQAYCVVLLQDPLTIQEGLSLAQLRSFVHPLSPLQFHVADPPQLPGTNDTHEPAEQAE